MDLGDQLCSAAGTRTRMTFHRDAGDLPPFWVQHELLSPSLAVHVITNQTLVCTCRSPCSGVFTLEFDGEATYPLAQDAQPADVESALLALANIEPGDVRVEAAGGSNFCGGGEPYFVIFEMPFGNQPALRALASFWEGDEEGGSIAVTTQDGTTESGVCNNAGFCDDAQEELLPDITNGTCYCDETYEADADVGDCGRPKYNTSAWTGAQRCDGHVLPTAGRDPFRVLNNRYLYVMDAGNFTEGAAVVAGVGVNRTTRFVGDPGGYVIGPVDPGEKGETTTEPLFNMSNGTADGVALDLGYRVVYHIDQKIGGVVRRDLAGTNRTLGGTVVLDDLSPTISGIALNLLFGEREAYVTDPGVKGKLDGAIYKFSIERGADFPFTKRTVSNLTAAINDQGYLLGDPYGIALDVDRRKVFWTEGGNETVADGRVYRCDFDGKNVVLVLDRGLVDPRGIALDLRNYTMFIADFGGNAVIKADMAYELDVRGSQIAYYRNRTWLQTIITEYEDENTGEIKYFEGLWGLVIDTTNDYLYFTDRGNGGIFRGDVNGSFGSLAVTLFAQQSDPLGIALDNGLGPQRTLEVVDCYGHGYCGGVEENFRCVCYEGWVGNCNMSSCPTGPAWFDTPSATNTAHAEAVCSNAGKCDVSTGLCRCHEGFEGGACDRLACPKGGTAEACSGHGECLTLRELGDRRTFNGDAAPVRYGTPRAGNASTWDADHVQGCLCESFGYFNGTLNNLSDWTGYDCSRRRCPTGDVAFTFTNGTKKVFEDQLLECFAHGGNFTLSFRTKTTKPIPWDASLATLRQRLVALDSIGSLDLITANSSETWAMCQNATGETTSNVTVRFTSELGDLPMLTADTTHLFGTAQYDAAVYVTEAVKGTKDDIECSNHGFCDHVTGECKCFEAYISSNADASLGLRGDCGYAEARTSSRV